MTLSCMCGLFSWALRSVGQGHREYNDSAYALRRPDLYVSLDIVDKAFRYRLARSGLFHHTSADVFLHRNALLKPEEQERNDQFTPCFAGNPRIARAWVGVAIAGPRFSMRRRALVTCSALLFAY